MQASRGWGGRAVGGGWLVVAGVVVVVVVVVMVAWGRVRGVMGTGGAGG